MKRINKKQRGLLRKLQIQDRKLKKAWSYELGVYREISGKLDQLKPRQRPDKLALEFVTKYSELLTPQLSTENLTVFREVKSKDGSRRVSINYQVDKLVVLGGHVLVHIDKKGVLGKVSSSLPRNVVVEGKATVDAKSIYRILMEKFRSHPDSDDYLEEHAKDHSRGDARFPATSHPKLILKRVENGYYHPAWMGLAILPVDLEKPVGDKRWMLTQAEYYLDATNGEFIKIEATTEYADVAVNVQGRAVLKDDGNLVTVSARGIRRDGGDYFLKNVDKEIDIITFDANGNDGSTGNELRDDTMDMSVDANGNWSDNTNSCTAANRTSSQQPEIDLHRFATQIYEFYDNLGWKGFDNKGWDTCPVRAVAHIGLDANAYFNKFFMPATGNMHGYIAFYDGKCDAGSLEYDFISGDLGIVAHEYQHAVTYFGVTKSNGDPGGLYSDTIRGAMREGYSDSFAGLISKIWNNPVPAPDGVCITGLPFRRVEYPRSNDTKDNDTYCDHFDDIGDQASKYYKSTNLSHVAFLLAQGGIHDRATRAPQFIPIPPIGYDKTARIWLTTLTEKLEGLAAGGGDPRMIDVADYLLETADDEYGDRSKEYVLLRRALYAAGLYPYNKTASPYTKNLYGGEACMLPWGSSWKRSQEYLSLPMFRYWQSLDLFIDNGSGLEYDATIGQENKIFARVRNIGDQVINNVTVEFWYRKAGAALPADEVNWKRCKDSGGNNCTKVIASIPAGSSVFDDVYTNADAVNWFLDPAEVNDDVNHFCLRAKILCDAPNHNNDYNNHAQSNVHHVLADADSDTDGLISFQVGNFESKKAIPLDLRIEHTLPKGVILEATQDIRRIKLKPEEERTISFKYSVPRKTLSKLSPPFDGALKGEIYGEVCGPFKGNLSKITRTINDHIHGVLSGEIGKIGTVSGRFEGTMDTNKGHIDGRALVSFTPYKAGNVNRMDRVIGIKAKLNPYRSINFTQFVDGEAVGGITVNIVKK